MSQRHHNGVQYEHYFFKEFTYTVQACTCMCQHPHMHMHMHMHYVLCMHMHAYHSALTQYNFFNSLPMAIIIAI